MSVKPLHRGPRRNEPRLRRREVYLPKGELPSSLWGGSSSSLRRALIAPAKNIDVASLAPRWQVRRDGIEPTKNRLFTHKKATKQRELFLLSTELN